MIGSQIITGPKQNELEVDNIFSWGFLKDLNLELLVAILLPGKEGLPKNRTNREESRVDRWRGGGEWGNYFVWIPWMHLYLMYTPELSSYINQ